MEYVSNPIPHIDFTPGVGFLELVANAVLYVVAVSVAAAVLSGLWVVLLHFLRSFRAGFRRGMDRG